MIFFLLLGLLLGALSVIFVLQNIMPITVMFLTWHLQGSLAAILFITLACGMLVALFLLLPSLIQDGMTLRKVRRQKEQLEQELQEQKQLVSTMASRPIVVTDTTASV